MSRECMTFNELSLWVRDYINSIDTNKKSLNTIKLKITAQINRSFKNKYITTGDKDVLYDRIKYLLELKVFNDAIEDMAEQYIKESAQHFLTKQVGYYKEDGRYFYNKKELDRFLDLFEQKNGDLSKIHIGIVYNQDDPNLFESYEVVHLEVWKRRRDLCWAK